MAARRRIAARRNWPANLYRNSQGYYWYKNPADGKTFGLGKDFRLASAQAKTANAELERRKGAVGLIHRIDTGILTFAHWCDQYEEAFVAAHSNFHTRSAMQSQLRAVRTASFAHQDLLNISTRDISAFVESAVTQRGAAMAANLRSRLHDIFRKAEAKGFIDLGKNPVAPTNAPKVKVARSHLTLEDFKAILAEARKKPEMCWAANAMELAIVTGQRREDIGALQFDQIKDGYLWIEQIKTKTKLRLPLSLKLGALNITLEAVLKRCRDNVVSRHLIHYVRHKGPSKPGEAPTLGAISKSFARFRDAAKIVTQEDKTPPSFHEIRSLSARLYADDNGPEFAQTLLGHKSAKMTALYRDVRGREWLEVKLGAS